MILRIASVAAAILVAGGLAEAGAQTATRGQAASPGQSRADNRLPQPPSGGIATGKPAAGPLTEKQRKADQDARKATDICKGC